MTKRILIVQSAKMGDMVCATPMFRAVKKTYPDSFLIVMGSKINGELLAGNPYIDKYVTELETNVDVAIFTSPNPDALLSLLLSGVRCIVPRIVGGWSPYATKKYRLLSFFATKVPHRMGSYAPREYLRLLEPLGIVSDDTKKELFFSQSALASARALLAQTGVQQENDLLVGIAPGVGNKLKVWGGEKFARVAEGLAQKHDATIVVLGGTADKEEVKKMISALSADVRVINLSERLSIEELKAAVSLLDIFISVDTGPIYIAEALEIPTVDIVGPMDEREQPPQGVMHRVIVPRGRKAPVLHIMNTSVVDREEARLQAAATAPEEVIEEAEKVLALIHKTH